MEKWLNGNESNPKMAIKKCAKKSVKELQNSPYEKPDVPCPLYMTLDYGYKDGKLLKMLYDGETN